MQAQLDLADHTIRVINIVKAKEGLKNKAQALDLIAIQYCNQLLEPQLRPEFVAELKKIREGKHHEFKDMQEFRELIESEVPTKRQVTKNTK